MSLIRKILEEEKNRLTELEQKYVKDISLLPKGVLVIKKRHHQAYVYHNFREGKETRVI